MGGHGGPKSREVWRALDTNLECLLAFPLLHPSLSLGWRLSLAQLSLHFWTCMKCHSEKWEMEVNGADKSPLRSSLCGLRGGVFSPRMPSREVHAPDLRTASPQLKGAAPSEVIHAPHYLVTFLSPLLHVLFPHHCPGIASPK